MANVTRSIVHIDEALCTGCGLCVMPCAEGAIEIVDGKAKVVKEELCDGAGFCLGRVPEGRSRSSSAKPRRRRKRRRRKDGRQARRRRSHDTEVLHLRAQRDGQPAAAGAYRRHSTWVCVKCLPQLIHG